MPLESASLGEKLRRTREQFGLDIPSLAEATGVPEERITSIEGEKDLPSGDEGFTTPDGFYSHGFSLAPGSMVA